MKHDQYLYWYIDCLCKFCKGMSHIFNNLIEFDYTWECRFGIVDCVNANVDTMIVVDIARQTQTFTDRRIRTIWILAFNRRINLFNLVIASEYTSKAFKEKPKKIETKHLHCANRMHFCADVWINISQTSNIPGTNNGKKTHNVSIHPPK